MRPPGPRSSRRRPIAGPGRARPADPRRHGGGRAGRRRGRDPHDRRAQPAIDGAGGRDIDPRRGPWDIDPRWGGRSPFGDPRVQDGPVRGGPVTRGSARAVSRTPLLVGLGAIALALLIGGVGAYLVLPSATIVVTPKNESVGPVGMTIRADSSVTSPDADAKVVPAEVVTVDATATNTFQTTGKRVEEAKAKGVVRFRNKDFTSSNTIAAGSVVSTQNGIRFRTDGAVTVPRADLVGFTVFPKSATVKVTAVKAGLEGNVEPNTIVVIPKGEDPISLDVVNPDETKGGKHDEFPRVSQKDVDAALAALEPQLQAAFAARLADPSIATPGATVFPETGGPRRPGADRRPRHARRPGGPVVRARPERLRDGHRRQPRTRRDRRGRALAGHHRPGPPARRGLDQGGRPAGRRERRPDRLPGHRDGDPGRDPRRGGAQGDGGRPAARRGPIDPRGLRHGAARGLAGLGVDGPDARWPCHADTRRGRARRDARTDGDP